MPQRYPIVSRVELHDVSPTTQAACERWLALCPLPPRQVDLLVIPRHGGNLTKPGQGLPPGFCDWLRDKAEQGHPLWLHGLTHGDDGKDAPEFQHLHTEEIHHRLMLGLRDWHEAGLPPVAGFCPPWWRAPAVLPEAAAQFGISSTASRWGVRKDGILTPCPALSSWGGNGVISWSWDHSLPLQAKLMDLTGRTCRITLHPQDFRSDAARILTALLSS